MNPDLKVLIIDDHPLITEAYKAALENAFTEDCRTVRTIICNDIDCVLNKMRDNNFLSDLDLILLDVQLPPSEKEAHIRSGEDLGIKIRKKNSSAKILVSTTFNDNDRIYSILKSFNPEGFLIKNDINKKELLLAVKKVVDDPPYYSKTVVQLMRKQISAGFVLDHNDRKILYELSIGTKLRDLQKVIPLSLGGIEKKRRNLKLLFGVEDDSDRTLVIKAKEKGFI